MTPGLLTGAVCLTAFISVNLSMCGYEKIINQFPSAELFLELEAWLARNRSKIIAAASKIGQNALKNKWVV